MANQKQTFWRDVVFVGDVSFPGNEGIIVPSGNIAQRPSPATNGTIRYNTDAPILALETYQNATWETIFTVSTIGSNDIVMDAGKTIDGRDISIDGTKLDTIETNAKDDQIAIDVPFTPVGTITASDVQNALNQLDTLKQATTATLQSISSLGTIVDRMLYTTGVGTWAESIITPFGRTLIDDLDAITARTTLDVPGLNASNTLAGVNVFSNLVTVDMNSTVNIFTVKSTATSAIPFGLRLFRDSISPTANDEIALIRWTGRNSIGEEIEYGTIKTIITSTTDGDEFGEIIFNTMREGVGALRMRIGSGVRLGSPSVGTAGANSINVPVSGGYYLDGVNILDRANTWTADQNIVDVDSGATEGPALVLYRNSPSPAALDQIGVLRFSGENSIDAKITYANINSRIIDPTSTSEDAVMRFATRIAGALGNRIEIGSGLYTTGATGGDQGLDTINASGVFDDGNQIYSLPDGLETEQTTSTGTQFDFTSIRSDAIRITVSFRDVSLSGTDDILVQIGDSGSGFETTGYSASCARLPNAGAIDVNSSTSGFIITLSSAGQAFHGHLVLTLHNGVGMWVGSVSGRDGTVAAHTGGGRKDLGAALDRVRVTRSGTDTFDGGSVNILVE